MSPLELTTFIYGFSDVAIIRQLDAVTQLITLESFLQAFAGLSNVALDFLETGTEDVFSVNVTRLLENHLDTLETVHLRCGMRHHVDPIELRRLLTHGSRIKDVSVPLPGVRQAMEKGVKTEEFIKKVRGVKEAMLGSGSLQYLRFTGLKNAYGNVPGTSDASKAEYLCRNVWNMLDLNATDLHYLGLIMSDKGFSYRTVKECHLKRGIDGPVAVCWEELGRDIRLFGLVEGFNEVASRQVMHNVTRL